MRHCPLGGVIVSTLPPRKSAPPPATGALGRISLASFFLEAPDPAIGREAVKGWWARRLRLLDVVGFSMPVATPVKDTCRRFIGSLGSVWPSAPLQPISGCLVKQAARQQQERGSVRFRRYLGRYLGAQVTYRVAFCGRQPS